MCRQAGITRATTIEEAFEAAATFATQPLPTGPRTAVVTTAGGWGVVTADAIVARRRPRARGAARRSARRDRRAPAAALEPQQPDRPRGRRDPRHDSRWCSSSSRAIPRSTRSSTSGSASSRTRRACCATGGFYPDHGLERIVAYHERQDARFAQAAADISDATGKPILTATELAVAAPDNPGPATVRATGRLCYPSANRAVTALGTPVAVRPLPPDPRSRLSSRAGAARRRGLACSRRSLAVAGVACVALGVRADPAPARAPAPRVGAAARSPTPLWSPRRVPALFVDAVAARRLHAAARGAIVAPVDACVAVDDRVDAARHASTPTTPLAAASTQKLLVAAAALVGARAHAPLRDPRGHRRGTVHDGDARRRPRRSSAAATRCSRPPTRRAPRPRRTRRSPTLADAIVAGRRAPHQRRARRRRQPLRPRARGRPTGRPARSPKATSARSARWSSTAATPTTASPATDPALDTVQAARRRCSRRAASQIAGGVRRRRDRAPTRRARDRARRLAAARRRSSSEMLTGSNNETAELLTRELGVAHAAAPARTAAGTKAIRGRAGAARRSGRRRRRCTTDPASRPTTASRARRCSRVDRAQRAARVRRDRSRPPDRRADGNPVAAASPARRSRAGSAPRPATSTASSASRASSTGAPARAEPRFAFLANGDFSTDGGRRACRIEIAAAIGAYPDAPAAAELGPGAVTDALSTSERPVRSGPGCIRPTPATRLVRPDLNWRRVADNPQQTVRELKELVIAYAKQETIDPLKGLTRYVGFGLGRRAAHRHRHLLPRDRRCCARCRAIRRLAGPRQLVVGAVRRSSSSLAARIAGAGVDRRGRSEAAKTKRSTQP